MGVSPSMPLSKVDFPEATGPVIIVSFPAGKIKSIDLMTGSSSELHPKLAWAKVMAVLTPDNFSLDVRDSESCGDPLAVFPGPLYFMDAPPTLLRASDIASLYK